MNLFYYLCSLFPKCFSMTRLLYIFLLLICTANILGQQKTVTYSDRQGLSHWIVSGMLQDRQGFMWFATWNGLNRYDGYEFRQMKSMAGDNTNIESDVIRRIALDADGNILCRTEAGTFLFDTHTYRLRDIKGKTSFSAISSTSPQSYSDINGITWNIERYGVSKTVPEHYPATIVAGTEGLQAKAFMRDGRHRWWLATKEDESIRIFDEHNTLLGYLGADGRLHHTSTSFNHRAYCMMRTHNGDIWIGCKPGALLRLRELPDGNYSISEIRDKALTCNIIYHIVEDGRGRLWLATFGGGIACITNPAAAAPTITTFSHIKPFNSPHRVRRILITPNYKIVCATTNGLIIGDVSHSDLTKSTFRTLHREGRRKQSLSCNAVMDVVMDIEGHIFVATENNGIDVTTERDLFAAQPVFRHYNCHNSSLSSDACQALALQPNGHLFVVCTDRVLDFDAHADATTTFSRQFWNTTSHFSEERPLQLYDGSWVFAQEQGAYIATQHSMQSRDYVPPLLFTELHVNGQQPFLGICAVDTITIAPNERNFSVSFAALDYSDNSGIRYRNRLNGGPWTYASSNRTLTFYNLAPATYTLEVQSTDKYGRWVPNNRSLVIIVKPYWYETWWAHCLGILIVIIILGAIVYTVLHIRALQRQRSELLTKYMTLLATSEDHMSRESEAPAHSNNTASSDGAGTSADADTPSDAMQALSPTLSAKDQRFLERVKEYIEANVSNSDANIDAMAIHAATSRSNLNRKLRSLVGITATQLLINARMQKAHRLLHDSSAALTVSDIAYQCGYSNPRYFSKCYKQRYGVSPTDHKEIENYDY